MHLVTSSEVLSSWPQFLRSSRQALFLEGIRLASLLIALVAFIFIQCMQREFVNLEVWSPVFSFLALSFLVHSVYVVFFQEDSRHLFFNGIIFGVDVLVIAAITYYTGVGQSVFLLLFLINILLCGLSFQKKAALTLALWTSVLYSGLLIFSTENSGYGLYMALVLNNLAFFLVAVLSGDLSEQVETMEEEIEERGEKVQLLKDFNEMIVSNVRTGLVTTDRMGFVTFINQAASHIFKDVLMKGKDCSVCFPDFMEDVRRKDWEPGSSAKRYELKYKQGEGALTLEVLVSPLNHFKKGHAGYVFLIQDLTQVKNMEFSLQQQEKLAALGRLAANMAHEIRNPLASISGSVQVVEKSMKNKSVEDKKLFKIVLKEIDRLNGLISGLLDFVRPEKLELDQVNVNQLISEVMDLVQVNKNLPQLVQQVRTLKSQKMVLGHYERLKQAFLNIVINAYQAVEGQRGRVCVETWDEENIVKIKTKDNGKGISDQNLKKMFEPFHTTKSKGTGLGLAITHKIVESHKGRIYAESELDQGTALVVELPVVSETKVYPYKKEA